MKVSPLNRVLAVAATAALGLGLAVVAAAAPASAHANHVSAAVACDTTTGHWVVTWTVHNDYSSADTISRSTDTTAIPNRGVVQAKQTVTYRQTVTTPATETVTITGRWADGYTQTDSGTIDKGQFSTSCGIALTPAAPSAKPATCTADGSLVIPTTAGVQYTGGSDGDGPGSYTIQASPQPGYVLSGTTSWPVTVEAKKTDARCDTIVQTPKSPTATAQVCTGGTTLTSGFITVTAQTGVAYRIHNTADRDGAKDVTMTAGDVKVAPGTYLVTATADAGYTLARPFATTLTVEPDFCPPTLADFTASATFTQPVCSPSGTSTGGFVTIDTTQLSSVAYTLDGATSLTSATTALPVGTHTVTATVPAGDTIDGDSTFTGTIAAAESVCGDLKTLAFTGPSAWGPYLAVAALMLGAGGFLISRSRTARRNVAE